MINQNSGVKIDSKNSLTGINAVQKEFKNNENKTTGCILLFLDGLNQKKIFQEEIRTHYEFILIFTYKVPTIALKLVIYDSLYFNWLDRPHT